MNDIRMFSGESYMDDKVDYMIKEVLLHPHADLELSRCSSLCKNNRPAMSTRTF